MQLRVRLLSFVNEKQWPDSLKSDCNLNTFPALLTSPPFCCLHQSKAAAHTVADTSFPRWIKGKIPPGKTSRSCTHPACTGKLEGTLTITRVDCCYQTFQQFWWTSTWHPIPVEWTSSLRVFSIKAIITFWLQFTWVLPIYISAEKEIL